VSQQINLFNPQFLAKRKYFSAVTMTQALGLLVLGMVAFYGFAFWQDKNLARQTGDSARAYEQQKQQFIKVTADLSPEKREAQLDLDLKNVDAEIALRRALLRELGTGVLARPAGYSEYLLAFARQTVPGLWLTRIQIAEAGGDLTVSGRALQADLVPVLIGRLKQETVLRGRPLEALAITRSSAGAAPARSIVEFTVSSPGSPEPGNPRAKP
jgi:hypothetical protein